jgi:hypothetical protein
LVQIFAGSGSPEANPTGKKVVCEQKSAGEYYYAP